jgi:subtilisin family serine protease
MDDELLSAMGTRGDQEMNPWKRLLICSSLCALTAASLAAAQRDQCIIRTPQTALAAVLVRNGMQLVSTLGPEVFLVQIPSGVEPASFAASLAADVDVLSFEGLEDAVIAESAPRAQLNHGSGAVQIAAGDWSAVANYGDVVRRIYVNQPATAQIRLPAAQKLATGFGAVVAIIDTGVDANHPALKGHLTPGYDFVHDSAGQASEWSDLDQSTAAILDKSSAVELDGASVVIVNQSTAAILDQSTAAILDTQNIPAAFGHGTMVAGIVRLVAPRAKIMPLKAFTAGGAADTADIIRAIYYAADNGATVINMSFSLLSPSREVMRAINYASEKGIFCVASVGNASSDALSYPAAFRNVIGVAATDVSNRRSAFSNYGSSMVTLAAPGEAVITTYPGGHYAAVWGTSFSAPFVAGAPALLRQVDSSLSPRRGLSALINAAEPTPQLGYGRLDLYGALVTRLELMDEGF